ncbi:hypothetical protein [Acidithiobacillus ferriphilus]|uniref:hypothetical protein n=1 Tax=Acidithiobacillus ferriphilus TaxID=1689834 RepID=UPI00232D7220|nr:hypothetical protein [Acidithiobacillus ferriphilus]WCE94342.1 hypothetical protein PJU76_02020 [Acidithiobacillus ferriphilus]
MFGLTEDEARRVKAKLDEIQTMHPHHTEPELVIMAVNRLWIDLIEAGREEPSMEDWRRTRAAMGYQSGTREDIQRAAKRFSALAEQRGACPGTG